jgi:chromosome segregation ATPase
VGEDQGTDRAAVTDPADPEQIREEIESTRQELGDTVAALSAKTDVKAQAKQKIDDTKAAVADKKDELVGKARDVSPQTATTAVAGASSQARKNPLPVAAAGAFAFGFLAGRVSKR